MTSPGRGLPRSARLLRPADFTRVYGRRATAADGPLVVYAAANGLADGRVRLGLSVSRRIGGAVVRNRWKRVLREAYRVVRAELPPAHDFVVVVRPGPMPVGADDARRLRESLAALAARAAGRAGRGPGGRPPRRGT